ncbi:ORC-CDC6 family AAA ATPase [Vibrio cholerae]|uniref:ORC-CDC6 family AAA ATPase n=1 Tax=Vibrio cholerae TaxID=666 RepID=UPI003F9794CD
MQVFFDSYNAKHMKSDEIAENFVSSDLFIETAKNSHTILVGPRGSGKTTFLRMLSNDTLHKWDGYKTLEGKGTIKYEGIYVPGDLVWGEMINSLKDTGLNSKHVESFSYSAFCTHVFLNVISGIENSLNKVEKDQLVSIQDDIHDALINICSILKISPEKVSISRIRLELNSKINVLGEYSRYLSIFGSDSFDNLDFEEKVSYAYTDLKMALESIFDAIDIALKRPEHRWALLLDEFEIAPQHLLDKVIRNMRSSARKVIFKVALVPCGCHQKIKHETSNINDYSIVELWYVKKGESASFCNNLVKSRYGIDSPVKQLGNTKYSSNIRSSSHWVSEFNELYSKDVTFKKYIDENNIDYIDELTKKERSSSKLRKISPQVAFRNAFINSNGKRKGRKSLPEFYSGWEAISTISEGNPRWLISVLNPLFASYDQKKVPDSQQMTKVKASTDSYRAMLKTLPLSNNMGLSTSEPVLSLLERIANYFNSRLIDDDFMPSPPSTFKVDRGISSDIEKALMIAWNYGAIVCVSPESTFGTYDNLQGLRFRLSHLLAPTFDLPLTTGPSINLSTVLSKKSSKIPSLEQGDLFE